MVCQMSNLADQTGSTDITAAAQVMLSRKYVEEQTSVLNKAGPRLLSSISMGHQLWVRKVSGPSRAASAEELLASTLYMTRQVCSRWCQQKLLVGNKCDLASQQAVSTDEAKELADSLNIRLSTRWQGRRTSSSNDIDALNDLSREALDERDRA